MARPKAPAVKPKICQPANNLLIIFVKYPQPGLVKTRLAKDAGKQNAAGLYRLFVEALLKRTEDKNYRRMLFYTPLDKESGVKKWLAGNGLEFHPQKGKDLGERLCGCFTYGFTGPAQRVVTIGTDCPMIDREIINSAFAALESKHCVLGPSLDGGYYLIGLSLLEEEIFKGICWGTKNVFNQTLRRIRATKMNYHILKPLFDIDTYQDAALLKEKLERTRRIPTGLGPLLARLRKLKYNKGNSE